MTDFLQWVRSQVDQSLVFMWSWLVSPAIAGRSTQTRVGLWKTVTQDGRIVDPEGKEYVMIALRPPKRVDEEKLRAFVLDICTRCAVPFRLWRITRPVSADEAVSAMRQMYVARWDDEPKLLPMLEQLEVMFHPHSLPGRDIRWEAMISTVTVLLVPSTGNVDQVIVAAAREAEVDAWVMNSSVNVIAFLRQLILNEVMTLTMDPVRVKTATNLHNLVAPVEMAVHSDHVAITGWDGRVYRLGFLAVEMTGQTALGDLSEAFGILGADIVVHVEPRDRQTVIHSLKQRDNRTTAEEELLDLYESLSDAPVGMRGLLVFKALTYKTLSEKLKGAMKIARSQFVGVRLVPILGSGRVEQALRAYTQPFYTPMPSGLELQPATSIASAIPAVGTMTMPEHTTTSLLLGQTQLSMQPVHLDQWSDQYQNAEAKTTQHLSVLGLSGAGKSTLLKSIVMQMLVNGGTDDVNIFDFKGAGDWKRLLERYTPAGVQFLAIDVQEWSREKIRILLMALALDRPLITMVESMGLDAESLEKLNDIGYYLWKRQEHRFKVDSDLKTLWLFDETIECFRSDNDMGRWIVKVATQGRSWGARMVMATQDPMGLIATGQGAFKLGEIAQRVCKVTIIGQLNNDAVPDLEAWGLAEGIAKRVPKLSRGQFVFHEVGAEPFVFELFITSSMQQQLDAKSAS